MRNSTISKNLIFTGLLIAFLIASSACKREQSAPVLKVEGIEFTLNGDKFDMWGIRVGSATMNDEYTQHLIDQLDDYKYHGVNTLAVFYMGTSGGYANAFINPDGSELDPENVIELCAVVHQVDPDRLVGAGGYNHDDNIILGRSPHLDVLLFDTSTDSLSSGELYRRFRADGVKGKPLVNVETFGGWTRNWPPGVFPDSVRASYYREISDAAAEPGLSVFIHNNPWLQGPAQNYPLRYDIAGYGSEDSPGLRWYFEAVREARGIN